MLTTHQLEVGSVGMDEGANYSWGWLGGWMSQLQWMMIRGPDWISQWQWGMIWGPDWLSQWGHWGTLYSYLLFATCAMGSFMSTVSQDLGLMSHPKDGLSYCTVSPSLHWAIGIDLRPLERVPSTGHSTTPLLAETIQLNLSIQTVLSGLIPTQGNSTFSPLLSLNTWLPKSDFFPFEKTSKAIPTLFQTTVDF